MDEARPRLLPAARAQQRREAERAASAEAAAAAAAPARPAAAADDCADALRKLPPSQKAWCQEWGRVQDKKLPRPVRAFAWLLAHAALPCGGAKVAPFPADGEGLAERVCCSNAACRAPPPPAPDGASGSGAGGPAGWRLETLQHAFLECPAVRPALAWLAREWARGGGAAPPLTAEVWLQGSPAAAWQPARDSRRMWRVLRITLLAAAWELRCTRDQAGVQFDAAAVARACAEAVRRLVHADWARVGNRDLPAAAGVCPSWFPRSRQVHLEWEDFQLAWCVGGVVARADQAAARNGQPTLTFLLDASTV